MTNPVSRGRETNVALIVAITFLLAVVTWTAFAGVTTTRVILSLGACLNLGVVSWAWRAARRRNG